MSIRLSLSSPRPPAHRKRVYARTGADALKLQPASWALDILLAPRLVSAALLVVCLAALLYFSLDEKFYIYDVQVMGHQYVEPGDIVAASDLEGLHVAWVQPERVAQLIVQRLPDVRTASVTCLLPAHCTITVEERHPLFIWQQNGARLWVDAEGLVFTAHEAGGELTTLEMPPGSLPLPGTRMDENLLVGVRALIGILPDLNVIRYTTERGLEFADPRGGWPVYLGSGPGMEARVAVWRALSDNLLQRGVRPTFIDVRYAQAPYYSTR